MMDTFFKGMGGLIPLLFLLVFAFTIGKTCKELGTGTYLASVTSSWLSPKLLPALMFLMSALMAFATGTSWGTFATMIPIGIPMVLALGANPYITLGAILGGGTFGDHSSPLSDTTIISSMAAATDHIDHVRTQLPYALITASLTFAFYVVWGLFV